MLKRRKKIAGNPKINPRRSSGVARKKQNKNKTKNGGSRSDVMLETVHPDAKSSLSQCTVHRNHLISHHVPQVHQWQARVVVVV